ncbi:hypothetical protein Scep_003319 [Stephania cephalantha]|uniref:Uncharacterized protein n=1 Tax=Stephania cephalantha TaxID=152367 RepID=A0AAP0PVP5_9MAGN
MKYAAKFSKSILGFCLINVFYSRVRHQNNWIGKVSSGSVCAFPKFASLLTDSFKSMETIRINNRSVIFGMYDLCGWALDGLVLSCSQPTLQRLFYRYQNNDFSIHLNCIPSVWLDNIFLHCSEHATKTAQFLASQLQKNCSR